MSLHPTGTHKDILQTFSQDFDGQSGEIVDISRRLKDETTADELDRKTDRQDLTFDNTDGIFVVSRTVVVNMDRERTLGVEVETM